MNGLDGSKIDLKINILTSLRLETRKLKPKQTKDESRRLETKCSYFNGHMPGESNMMPEWRNTNGEMQMAGCACGWQSSAKNFEPK